MPVCRWSFYYLLYIILKKNNSSRKKCTVLMLSLSYRKRPLVPVLRINTGTGAKRSLPSGGPLSLPAATAIFTITNVPLAVSSPAVLSMNLGSGSGSGLRSRIRRKIRHATGRPMDARPDPDHGLPDLRPRSTPRSSPGSRRAPAWRHRGVGFSGGRWSTRIRGVGRGASGPKAPKTITGVKIGVNAHFKGFRPQGEALLALLVESLSVTLSVGRESGGLLRGAAGGP